MQRPSLGSAATRSEQSLDPAAPSNGLGAPDSTEPRRLVPPRPAVPNSVPPWYWPVDVLRMDPLCVWPEQAYEDDTYVRNFLGLKRSLLNSTTAIRNVLIDNIGTYS